MTEIVIASPVTEQLADFSKALAQASGLVVTRSQSVTEALTRIAEKPIALLIADARLGADEVRQLIRDTLMINAMISSAVLSDTAEEDFHEYMEGLGVLMLLPLTPTKRDAQALWERYQTICG